MPACHPEDSGRVRVPSGPQNGAHVKWAFLRYMTFHVYILRSLKDGTFYIGYTSDVDRRLAEHNAGLSRYSSRKVPWEIFYVENFDSKTEAIKRERFFKKQRNKEFFLR